MYNVEIGAYCIVVVYFYFDHHGAVICHVLSPACSAFSYIYLFSLLAYLFVYLFILRARTIYACRKFLHSDLVAEAIGSPLTYRHYGLR